MDGQDRVGVAADIVAGVFDRERLSAGLVATHRAGFGPHARVLDGARGDLSGQLRRAGIVLPIAPADGAATTAIILVTAPGRSAPVADLLSRAGARSVHAVARGAPVADAPRAVAVEGVPPLPPEAGDRPVDPNP